MDGLDSSVNHRITIKLGWATAIASLSTFQFGFHLAELNTPSEILSCNFHRQGPLGNYEDTFLNNYGFNQCIPMNDEGIAWVTTMLTLGGLVSSIIFGSTKLTSDFGRRYVCFFNSILFMIGSLFMTFTNKFWIFSLGRFVIGLAAGSSMVVSPILVNELTPLYYRGLLGSILQLAVALGILAAQLISYIFSNDEQWRFVYLCAASIGLIQFIALFTTVESPKWLIIRKGDVSSATNILHGLRTDKNAVNQEINHWRRLSINIPEAELNWKNSETTTLLNSSDSIIPLTRKISRRGSIDPSDMTTTEFIRNRKYRRELIAIIIIMSCQQLVGMNAITFYGLKIMKTVLPSESNVLILNCSFSLCNVLCALIVSPFVDKIGRKPLLLASIFIMGTSSFLIGFGLVYRYDYLVAVSCMGFIAGYSIGLGPIPFLMVSELTRHEVVGVAQSLGSTINWLSTILIALFFPIIQDHIGGYVFFIFVAICIIYFYLTMVKVPETKSLETYEEVWNDC